MKRITLLLTALFASLVLAYTQTSISPINIGATNNDKTGDTLRVAFGKINTNFTYVTNLAFTISANTNFSLINVTNSVTAGSFIGNGTAITNLQATNVIGGVTTNLQFTFNTSRTNTLYFTNGVLLRVTQP
jgi:hypothetical protein